jgi:hypothetical protein
MNAASRSCGWFGVLALMIGASGSLITTRAQTDSHQIPVMDGEAGPCSVSFTVSDEKGAPVYDARIRVHIAYGFGGFRRLDLEAATNVDGKALIKGLPRKVKGDILYFHGTQGNRGGDATYDPAKNCGGINSSIILKAE